MRRVEQNDQPREEIEHTLEAYAVFTDRIRALERSGVLRTWGEEEKGVRIAEVE